MRTRCRTRGRAPRAKKRVLDPYSRMVAHFGYMQDAVEWTEWSFRLISQRQMDVLISLGEVEPVYQAMADVAPGPGAIERCIDAGKMEIVGYRATRPTSWERPSPATLTFATMIAVGNATDAEAELTRRQQREVTKFKVWPLIGDTRAVAVRPRISERERRMAEKLAPVSPYAEQSRAAAGMAAA